MAKDYLCKDCDNNNHGWCNYLKKNGLKDITNCSEKKVNNVLINQNTNSDKEKEFDTMPYKVFGKREMFFIIQQQLQAMNDEDTVKTVKQIMVNLNKMIEIEEQIHGIACDYMIDEDIINNSKILTNYWLKEVGEYKGNE